MISIKLISKFCQSQTSNYEYLYGVYPVMIALHNSKRTHYKLFVHQPTEIHNPRIISIINKAKELSLPIDFYEKVF